MESPCLVGIGSFDNTNGHFIHTDPLIKDRSFFLFVYLLDGNERIYWILDLENEVHSIWDLWKSAKCKVNGYLKLGRVAISP